MSQLLFDLYGICRQGCGKLHLVPPPRAVPGQSAVSPLPERQTLGAMAFAHDFITLLAAPIDRGGDGTRGAGLEAEWESV